MSELATSAWCPPFGDQPHRWDGNVCANCSQIKDALYYDDLVFGSYDINTVLAHVDDVGWQDFRISMKGESTVEKLRMLRVYVQSHRRPHPQNPKIELIPFSVCVRVTNYIYALKRGGQLK